MRSQFESKDRHPVSTGFDLDWSYTSHQHQQQRLLLCFVPSFSFYLRLYLYPLARSPLS